MRSQKAPQIIRNVASFAILFLMEKKIGSVVNDLWYMRVMDAAFCVLAVPAAGAVVVLSAVPIKLSSRGPVFFRQTRVGLQGREFIIWKLRTMEDGGRITSVGRILRKTGLDETPQVWNILTGEMAVFGPRPRERSDINETYIGEILSVRKPGLFGILPSIAGAGTGRAHGYSIDELIEMEKEEINTDDGSQEALREYYADLLGYVGTNAKFNTIAAQDDIAVLNITIDGKDKRVLTRLYKGAIASSQQDLTNAKLIRTESLIVLGNISLKGILFSEAESSFGPRKMFE